MRNKSVKMALLLSNVIDADHQNSCLFTNKGHFSLPLWVLIDPYDHYAACWVTLTMAAEVGLDQIDMVLNMYVQG